MYFFSNSTLEKYNNLDPDAIVTNTKERKLSI